MSLGKCPQCGKPAHQDARPFCSKRCADLDLGAWLNESYILPGTQPVDEEDLDRIAREAEGDPSLS